MVTSEWFAKETIDLGVDQMWIGSQNFLRAYRITLLFVPATKNSVFLLLYTSLFLKTKLKYIEIMWENKSYKSNQIVVRKMYAYINNELITDN